MTVGRRRARRDALFVLYQADLMGLVAGDALRRAEAAGAPFDSYTRLLIRGVGVDRQELDSLLQEHLQGWTVDRLAPLERNIMRLALYEMRAGDEVPPAVAIDEAVELAKRYCSDEAASLVNGVLGALLPDRAK